MYNEFMDNPFEITKWISYLDKNEQGIFKKGYITCLHKLLEQISDSKFKISNKMLDSESERQKELLQSRLHILDIYEEHYMKIAEQMQQEMELQS